jgi:magnesium transporter
MIRSQYFSPDSRVVSTLAPDLWKDLIAEPAGVLWVDIFDEPADRSRDLFGEVFGFHRLVIDDALQDTHSPKINEWDGYLYVVIHAPFVDSGAQAGVTTKEFDIFLGKNYILTYHKKQVACISHLWESISQDHRVLQKGPSYILYRLGDQLVNDFLEIIDQIDQQIDGFEEVIFSNPQQLVLEEIFTHKSDLFHLRRILSYQREVYNKLARDDYVEINSANRVYFRDVYDHFVRIHDIAEGLREMISATLEIYLSMINNQMNQIMKTLTLFTALFMPLTFLTGFFGMNFFAPQAGLEIWSGREVFGLLMITLLLVPAAMFLWMRRKQWF